MVKWNKSEDGYCESKCGRFKITPQWWGRVQPQEYKITDKVTEKKSAFSTQRNCKKWADNIVLYGPAV